MEKICVIIVTIVIYKNIIQVVHIVQCIGYHAAYLTILSTLRARTKHPRSRQVIRLYFIGFILSIF